jgi:Protein of unknown function (DUF2934)
MPEVSHDYRSAFEDFSAKVRKVQSLSAQPNLDRAVLDEAILDLERARLKYNKHRDSLAEQLWPASAAGFPPAIKRDSSEDYVARIREIAELLWEVSGKPDGTAKDDWARAEEIIRRTTAPDR